MALARPLTLAAVGTGTTVSICVASLWNKLRSYASTANSSSVESNAGEQEKGLHPDRFLGEVVMAGRSPSRQWKQAMEHLQSVDTVGLSFTVAASGEVCGVKLVTDEYAVFWPLTRTRGTFLVALRKLLEDPRLSKVVYSGLDEVKMLRSSFGMEVMNFVDSSLSLAVVGLQNSQDVREALDVVARRCCNVMVEEPSSSREMTSMELPDLMRDASAAWGALRVHSHMQKLLRDRPELKSRFRVFPTAADLFDRDGSQENPSLVDQRARKSSWDKGGSSVGAEYAEHRGSSRIFPQQQRPWDDVQQEGSSSNSPVLTETSVESDGVSISFQSATTISSMGSEEDMPESSHRLQQVANKKQLFPRLREHLSTAQEKVSEVLHLYSYGTSSCHGSVSTVEDKMYDFVVTAQSVWDVHRQAAPTCHGSVMMVDQVMNDMAALNQIGALSSSSCHGSAFPTNTLRQELSSLRHVGALDCRHPTTFPSSYLFDRQTLSSIAKGLSRITPVAVHHHFKTHEDALREQIAQITAKQASSSSHLMFTSVSSVRPMLSM